MVIKSEVIVILSAVLLTVRAQDSCTTPDQLPGSCKLLLSCQTILTLYASDKSLETINYIIGTQTACGNKAVGRNPYICCRDDFPAVTVKYSEETTTLPTPPVTINPEYISLIPTIHSRPIKKNPPASEDADVDNRATGLALELLPPFSDEGESCYTPDEIRGNCMNIKNCTALVEELKLRKDDPVLIRYIQKSNEICHKAERAVCCPRGSPILINVRNEIDS